MPLYVTSGKEWDAKRNTSMVHAQFVKLCRDARARGDEWITWIDDGCPDLTQAEYDAWRKRNPRVRSRTRR